MNLKSLFLAAAVVFAMTTGAAEMNIPQHLQDVSVTIVSEGKYSRGEGSGVIFTRKDKDGKLVNFVWTAAHVIDNLRTTRDVIVDGTKRVVVEFRDAKIVKEIRQDGRTVGKIEMAAEVLKYSDSEDGHDLALLRLRKRGFVKESTTFYLDKDIPGLGTDLLHVGSLLGQMGANSMTAGIYSQHGRLLSINKLVFDQTTVNAFPGSSGGGVYLKSDARYIGMLVRGAGETFNLIVPIRRMSSWAEKNKIEWALDPKVALPTDEEIAKLPIEDVGSKLSPKGTTKSLQLRELNSLFPYMLRVIPLHTTTRDSIINVLPALPLIER